MRASVAAGARKDIIRPGAGNCTVSRLLKNATHQAQLSELGERG
jgi:hypothetical protein